MAASTGGTLVCDTVTVKLCAALIGGTPLSVTRTVIVSVLGAYTCVGVHAITPEPGLIAAPVGAPGSRLKASVCSAGMSGSAALAVKCQ